MRAKNFLTVIRKNWNADSRYRAAWFSIRNQAAISILKEVFAMSETDYNARLYEKMKAEQDKYHLPFCT